VSVIDRALAASLPYVPRAVVRRVASRYIAGEDLGQALRVAKRLNADGQRATLDVLGEEVRTGAEAAEIVAEYLRALDLLAEGGVRAGVSVKPTGLGLAIRPGLCRENVETIVRAAAERDRFVRIDMEDSSTTSETLAIYRELRTSGLDNVGVVLQARLRRTEEDARALAGLRPSVRLCKGIYLEPESVAHQDESSIRASFLRTAETLLDAGSFVAFATHGDFLIERCLALVRERGLTKEQYEFQLLLGVRPELGSRLVADGHRVRVYVPYGKRSYEYSVRRLQENPIMATQVALAVARRPWTLIRS
jgi:proline dehydrogenase